MTIRNFRIDASGEILCIRVHVFVEQSVLKSVANFRSLLHVIALNAANTRAISKPPQIFPALP